MRIFLAAILLTAAIPACAQQSLITTTTVTVEQLYVTKNLRDPLLASTVYGDSKGRDKLKGAQAGVAASSFTIYNLALTGVMEDSRGRIALLRDTATGALYKLQSGRITDSKNRPVPGVSGVVKGKQVVLMTEDKKVNQLNLHERSEQVAGPER